MFIGDYSVKVGMSSTCAGQGWRINLLEEPGIQNHDLPSVLVLNLKIKGLWVEYI